jgi:RNA polymerase sigma-70 factor, ECF subfamily
MAARTGFNAWPETRHTGITGSVSGRVIHDASFDSVPSSAGDWARVASGRKECVGAEVADETLTRAALEGQVWAQREIWYRFAPMVYGLFRRALCQRNDHDDLTQEVFLRVFCRLHTLENASAIRSFVYSVAVRVVGEEVRRFAWRRRILEGRPDLSMPSTSSPADFEVRETMLYVQRGLDGLRDKHRAVFILRYVEGMDLREVALGLGISRATAKRYLAKALASLCKFVAKEEGEGRTRLGTSTPLRLFGGRR